jgi:hypothetical protein
VVSGIKAALPGTGRTIDDDHYGAGFPFRFGSWDDEIVERTEAAYSRLGNTDPKAVLAVGDASTIASRCAEYVSAGASKFVLRPIASGDAEIMAQTRRLIEEVLPAVHS